MKKEVKVRQVDKWSPRWPLETNKGVRQMESKGTKRWTDFTNKDEETIHLSPKNKKKIKKRKKKKEKKIPLHFFSLSF